MLSEHLFHDRKLKTDFLSVEETDLDIKSFNTPLKLFSILFRIP